MVEKQNIAEELEAAIIAAAPADMSFYGATYEEKFLQLVEREASIGATMQDIVLAQAKAENCAKPIGLYLGDMQIVGYQDRTFAPSDSGRLMQAPVTDEKKRMSLLESYKWHGCVSNDGPETQPRKIADDVAGLLRASRLSLPEDTTGDAELVAYVETKLDEIEVEEDPDNRSTSTSIRNKHIE